MGRLSGTLLGAALAAVLPLSGALSGANSGADPKEDCLDLVQLVTEDMSQDQSLISRLRDQLARAAELCRRGRTEDAEALLREIQGKWMPMGAGN